MRWKEDKRRFTVKELAEYFGREHFALMRRVRQEKVDLKSARGAIAFVERLVKERVVGTDFTSGSLKGGTK